MDDCVTACSHCGSKIKGKWTQKELEFMANYSKKHNSDFIEVKYEKEMDGVITALHLNKMYFNWVIWKERFKLE